MGLTRFQDRWDELNDLFHQARALPPEDVPTFCEEACGDDDELREFLYQLVSSAEAGDEKLRGSISQIAQDVAAVESLAGQRVGAYQFDEMIGRGGMGEVYLASRADGEFEKTVAIKIVRHKLATDEFAHRVRTERQVMANLNHPSIPALVDAGQLEDGRPYFICDYVDGLPIDVYCETHALSIGERLNLIGRVGEALQHAHSNLILHLDIKPDNILVQKNGSPSLLDFGVARLMGDHDDGYRAFSPGYASPEQIRGERLSAASDVYSLGALMYHLLAGKPPFSAPRFAPSETIMAERVEFTERLAQPDQLLDVDGDIRAIVRKTMAEKPADRYISVGSFLRDLKNYRNKRPVSARPSTYAYRLGKFLRRNTLVLATVAAAFVTLAAFGFREAELRKQAAQEAETARQVSAFLVGVFEIADPTEARGNSVTARELLDKGAERIGEDLVDQPLVAASLMKTIGQVYMKLGLYKQSASTLERAVALRESLSQDDDLDSAELLEHLNNTYRKLARYEEAESVAKRALAIRENALGPNDVLVADSLGALARLAYRQGRYDEAERKHLRRIDIYERALGAAHPSYGIAVWDLAPTYNRLGRYDEAEQLFLRALEILQAAWGPDHPDLGVLYQNLGNLYGQIRRYEDAEQAFARSLTLEEAILGPDHARMAGTLRSLATVLMFQGKLDAAETYVNRAIEIDEKTHGPDDFRSALGHLTLSGVYEGRGHLDLAEREALAALKTLESKFGPDHTFPVYASKSLASVYHKQGRLDKAESYYLRALKKFNELPRDDPDRIETTQGYTELLRATDRGEEADRLEAGLQE